MRPSEQYGLDWSKVDLSRNSVSLPKTKTGKARHIRLNAVAVAAFKVLLKRSLTGGVLFLIACKLVLFEWFAPSPTKWSQRRGVSLRHVEWLWNGRFCPVRN
jgi:integrase